MNLNKLAVEISKKEVSKGKKRKTHEVNIANIKEIMKIFLEILAKEDPVQVIGLLERYR